MKALKKKPFCVKVQCKRDGLEGECVDGKTVSGNMAQRTCGKALLCPRRLGTGWAL